MYTIALQKISLLLCLSLLPITLVAQNEFQVELSFDYSKEKESIDEIESTFLGAVVYFDKVEVGSNPYAEAAFLEQSSGIAVGFVETDFSLAGSDLDSSTVLLLAHYVLPDSPFIIEAGIANDDLNFNNGFNGRSDVDAIVLGVGAYIGTNSAVMLNYTSMDFVINPAPGIVASSKADLALTSIEYKIIEKLEGSASYGINALIGTTKFKDDTSSETNVSLMVEGDYYLNQSTSVGVLLELNSGDDKSDEGQTVGAKVNHFLTPVLAVFAEFHQFSAESTSVEDSDEIVLGVTARF